jgi:KipI family sensor histidine kinase inhibitor
VHVLRRVGDQGVLVEVADAARALAVARTVRDRMHDRVEDVVPAHATVLVTWRGRPADDELRALLDEEAGPPPDDESEPVTLPVTYDGPDLESVATLAQCSPEEVVRRHTAAQYTVAFIGFAPGFAYLLGTDPRLDLPRRDVPRERVPAGSVAIAAGYTSVYPRESPGGWHLLGRTATRMFDPQRTPPVLLSPGTRVTFSS